MKIRIRWVRRYKFSEYLLLLGASLLCYLFMMQIVIFLHLSFAHEWKSFFMGTGTTFFFLAMVWHLYQAKTNRLAPHVDNNFYKIEACWSVLLVLSVAGLVLEQFELPAQILNMSITAAAFSWCFTKPNHD